MVFYRKYRPQTISDLDSKDVATTLTSLFEKSVEDVPHAFLFTGSKGLGKTSTARIIAKVLNCTNRKKGSIEPCNTCDMCISITNGSNLDVLEIDGASNRGIDEIRDLREKIKLSPLSSKRKVYIIDEVHMLTTEAFNALLKTLEEPPSHAVFILCTTEIHKVPGTIMSRCFHVSFKKATDDEIVNSLERIVKGEKLDVEKEALQYIATMSEGAFRDAAKIIEEVALSANSKKITKKLVEEKYKTTNIDIALQSLLQFLEEKNAAKAFGEVGSLFTSGIDMGFVIEELIRHLHEELLHQINNEKVKFGFTTEDLKELIELLNTAHSQLKFAVMPQLPLELVIVDWCNKSEKEVRGAVIGSNPASAPSSLNLPVREGSNEVRAVGSPPADTTPHSLKHDDFWYKFLDQVKSHNGLVAGVLRSCQIGEHNNDNLTIVAKFKFHNDKLNENITILEDSLTELNGKPSRVTILLKE